MHRSPMVMLVLLTVFGAAAATELRTLAEWDGELDDAWQRRDFEGRTHYSIGDGEPPHVIARTEAGASALYREVEVDLSETPWLQWSWRVEQLPAIDAPETERAGDDYGARVYVVREGLFGKLSTNALNYVWSQRQPVDSHWPNAYAGRARMWSVERGTDRLGEWITHTRNVRADWREIFDHDIERIDGVAIMTDADDSASRAEARYGTIRFCSTPACEHE